MKDTERTVPYSVSCFEKHFPCPRNCCYVLEFDEYRAEEPYHWGADRAADDQTKFYRGWKAAKVTANPEHNGETGIPTN